MGISATLKGRRASLARTQPAWFGITPRYESKGGIGVAMPGRDVTLYPMKRRAREVGRDRDWVGIWGDGVGGVEMVCDYVSWKGGEIG